MMIECCENPDEHHQAIFDKYAEKKFKEASILVQRALDAGFTLPHQNRPVRAAPEPFFFEDAPERFVNKAVPVKA